MKSLRDFYFMRAVAQLLLLSETMFFDRQKPGPALLYEKPVPVLYICFSENQIS